MYHFALLTRVQGWAETIRRCKEHEFVVSAKLEDEERTALIEKIKEQIVRFGGTVSDVDEWGKKKLAYEIQKQTEGFYYFVHFESEASCPAEVVDRVRIMDNVLRYLCVRQDA